MKRERPTRCGEDVPRHRHNVPVARRLRRDQTPTEAILWRALRGGLFEGIRFRRQHPLGRFVLDFYCPTLQLAIEIDGGIHRAREQQLRDRDRQALLEQRGIQFLRVAASEVENDLPGVLARIFEAIQRRERLTPRPPLPLTQERGWIWESDSDRIGASGSKSVSRAMRNDSACSSKRRSRANDAGRGRSTQASGSFPNTPLSCVSGRDASLLARLGARG